MNGFSDVLSTPVRRALIVAVAAAISLFAWQLVFNAAPASAAYTTTVDEQGANDVPGQKDLTQHAIDPSGLPTSIDVQWSWDDTGWSGSNTGDACTLFDTDNDTKANFSLCVTVEDDPAVQSSLSPRLFICGDDKPDRCTNPQTQLFGFSSTCTVAITNTQPFATGDDTPFDTTATCHIVLADVGATSAKLLNTCSYPSNEPGSDPSDCVLIVRDGVLIIKKVATPNDATAQFGFKLDGGATNVFTANGSQTSDPIAVTPGAHSVAESAPSGWQLDSATCSDGSGTLSGNTLSSINIASDESVTCTFNNSQQTGTLTVIKHVVNDNGGTKSAGDFSMHVKSGGTDVTGSPQAGAESPGTAYTLNTGTYNVSEDAVSGYTPSYSGDCNSSGDVTVPAAGSKTCTITNNDQAAKLK